LSGDIERCPGPHQNETFDADMKNVTNNKGMKVFHLKVRGLWSNLAHIFDILTSHRNIDIFSVSETHIIDEPGELFDIDGYDFVYKRRKNGKGGGVAFYINERLEWRRRDDLESAELESIWIEIFIKGLKNIPFVLCTNPQKAHYIYRKTSKLYYTLNYRQQRSLIMK
jgi:exonuclease III